MPAPKCNCPGAGLLGCSVHGRLDIPEMLDPTCVYCGVKGRVFVHACECGTPLCYRCDFNGPDTLAIRCAECAVRDAERRLERTKARAAAMKTAASPAPTSAGNAQDRKCRCGHLESVHHSPGGGWAGYGDECTATGCICPDFTPAPTQDAQGQGQGKEGTEGKA